VLTLAELIQASPLSMDSMPLIMLIIVVLPAARVTLSCHNQHDLDAELA
jgi:cell division protein FtsL